jgi:hypothetical protein
MTRIMLHCIKIKENFCAVHDEKDCVTGQDSHGDLAHGPDAQGASIDPPEISPLPDRGLELRHETMTA